MYIPLHTPQLKSTVTQRKGVISSVTSAVVTTSPQKRTWTANCTSQRSTLALATTLLRLFRVPRIAGIYSTATIRPATTSSLPACSATSSTSIDYQQTKMSHEVKDHITLTPAEQALFSTLLAATQHAGSNTVLRCAGGWVRDKLLGKESLDIDIALDNMLGKDFAELVNTYLQSQGKETRTAAVIQSNPDQSKHLETARMKINDMLIDLVNLRSETYAQDSRIPQMQFGTPEQDAMRRDFTINSLFYNINQACVEDLTKNGLDDLRAGLIRTPLPPSETFLDDPLRVLRAVRFATRFGFNLHEDILQAAASEPVRTALAQKVSKERIGTELLGMFDGKAPVAAMKLLHDLSLFSIVFALPKATADKVPANFGTSCTACMQATEQLLKEQNFQVDVEERRFLLFAALMLPLRLCEPIAAQKGKPQTVLAYIVREAIKWRAKEAEVASLLHEQAPVLLEVYCELLAAGSPAQSDSVPDDLKKKLGNSLRKLKQYWKLGVLLAPNLALDVAKPLGIDDASPGRQLPAGLPKATNSSEEASRSQEICRTLLAVTEACGLTDCWQWKPLLDGKQVMSALGLQKPGPELGKAMEEAMSWQLVNPQGTLEQCQQHLRQWRAQGP